MFTRWLPQLQESHSHITPKAGLGVYPCKSLLHSGWKTSPSTLPFLPYWPELRHLSTTLWPVAGKRDQDCHDWLGAERLGPGPGILPPVCAAPDLNQTDLLSSKNKSKQLEQGPRLRYIVSGDGLEQPSKCGHCANVKDKEKTQAPLWPSHSTSWRHSGRENSLLFTISKVYTVHGHCHFNPHQFFSYLFSLWMTSSQFIADTCSFYKYTLSTWATRIQFC